MRRFILITALCAAGFVALAPLLAQDAKTPAKPAAAAAAAADKRTPDQIQDELQKTGGELQAVLGKAEVMFDPAKRKEVAPKAIPLIRRMVGLLDEALQVQPQEKDGIASARMEFLTILTVLGDANAKSQLAELGKSQGSQSVEAQSALHLADFWADPKDEARQLKVIGEVQQLAKANPTSDAIGQTLASMAHMGAASKAVSEKAEDVLMTDLTTDRAKEAGVQIRGERKLRAAIGKPIELTGLQADGTAFSTKGWNGKVVLVDFWATWCAPCVAGLPRVKKAYLDYHAKGLEILGVSSDREPEALKEFLAKNKDMPWPQLFDPKENPKSELSPVAREWGVNILPAMFLIDKKGVLRSADAEADFEEQIAKLLAE